MNNISSIRVSPSSDTVVMTADCAIFGFSENRLRVLLVRRAVAPFADRWVLPGGAMAAGSTLESTAARVLRELVGVENVAVRQVATYSHPHRHPVRRVVTTSYYALVKPEDHHPVARQYLAEVGWWALDEVPELGFDHSRLLEEAYERLKHDLSTSPLAFGLLPDNFTLRDAQLVYEAILGTPLDRGNFRRKVLTYDFLVNTDRKRAGVKGGPLLYEIDRQKFANHQP